MHFGKYSQIVQKTLEIKDSVMHIIHTELNKWHIGLGQIVCAEKTHEKGIQIYSWRFLSTKKTDNLEVCYIYGLKKNHSTLY